MALASGDLIAGRPESAIRPRSHPGSASLSVISPARSLRAKSRRYARQVVLRPDFVRNAEVLCATAAAIKAAPS